MGRKADQAIVALPARPKSACASGPPFGELPPHVRAVPAGRDRDRLCPPCRAGGAGGRADRGGVRGARGHAPGHLHRYRRAVQLQPALAAAADRLRPRLPATRQPAGRGARRRRAGGGRDHGGRPRSRARRRPHAFSPRQPAGCQPLSDPQRAAVPQPPRAHGAAQPHHRGPALPRPACRRPQPARPVLGSLAAGDGGAARPGRPLERRRGARGLQRGAARRGDGPSHSRCRGRSCWPARWRSRPGATASCSPSRWRIMACCSREVRRRRRYGRRRRSLPYVASGDVRVRVTGSVALTDEEFASVAEGALAGTSAAWC